MSLVVGLTTPYPFGGSCGLYVYLLHPEDTPFLSLCQSKAFGNTYKLYPEIDRLPGLSPVRVAH